jgi:hypothetical protein
MLNRNSMKKSFLSTLLVMLAAVVIAQPLPMGSSSIIHENNGEPLSVFTYKPATYKDPCLIQPAFHQAVTSEEES